MRLLGTLIFSLAVGFTTVNAQFVGGYALRVNSTCPTEMTDCGPVSSSKGNACCPDGQVCQEWKSRIQGCCADENDCEDVALVANVCADDSWSLYLADEINGFCCASNLVGYGTYNYLGAGLCVNPGTPIGRGESELNIQSQGFRGAATPSSTSTTSSPPSASTGSVSGTSGSDEPNTTGSNAGETISTVDQMPPSGTDTAAEKTSESNPAASTSALSSESSSPLSTGAIVGIAVGGGVLLIVIAVGAWFFIRRSRMKGGPGGKYEVGGIQG